MVKTCSVRGRQRVGLTCREAVEARLRRLLSWSWVLRRKGHSPDSGDLRVGPRASAVPFVGLERPGAGGASVIGKVLWFAAVWLISLIYCKSGSLRARRALGLRSSRELV